MSYQYYIAGLIFLRMVFVVINTNAGGNLAHWADGRRHRRYRCWVRLLLMLSAEVNVDVDNDASLCNPRLPRSGGGFCLPDMTRALQMDQLRGNVKPLPFLV